MKRIGWVYTIAGLSLILLLAAVTLMRQDIPFWDEAYYLENVKLLNELGFSHEFLIRYKGPAGPTYAVMHYLLSPLTKLQVPYVRLVNICFLLLIISIMFLTLKKVKGRSGNSLPYALSALSMPVVYTISGLILTEIFAIFFLTIFIYLLTSAFLENKNNTLLAFLAGLSLSLAILGRQPVIAILLAVPFLFIDLSEGVRYNFEKRKFLKFAIVACCTSLVIPLWIFSVWGNIQPTSQAITGVGMAPSHLLLGFGYAALFVLFSHPTYFFGDKTFSNRYELAGVVLISVLINILFLKVSYTPLRSVLANQLPENLIGLYGLLCGTAIASLGLTFVYYFLKKQISTKNRLAIFFSIGFILIIATSLKVTHQFSARYVSQAFPLLVLALNIDRVSIRLIDIMFLITGGLLGLISLESYFG